MDSRMVRYFEKKKFMWDGSSYQSDEEAKKKEVEYKQKGFDVKRLYENGEYLIYTRREVKEVIVTNK